jgi:hypothetical protein
MQSGYFGDEPSLETDAMSRHIPLGKTAIEDTRPAGVDDRPLSFLRQRASSGYTTQQNIAKPLSFLRPITPYGETYTPSYTSFLNSPANSYNHPLHTLFNDRRPSAPPIRSTLFPKEED